jgi:FMN-dependent NADH-azoreductase
MKLLHVDSSILGSNSVSRLLTAEIVADQTKRHPGLQVVREDLVGNPLPHLSPAHVAARFGATPDDATTKDELARDEALIQALFDADIIVIGAPMYNFGIPSQLKAWIDRILVAGKTFKYTEAGPVGLMPAGKAVIIASSRGGAYGPGTPAASLDHQETYLRDTLAFIGLTDVTIVRAEGVAMGPEARDAAIAGALSSIAHQAVAA